MPDSPEPRFKRGEQVHFIGGAGIVRSYELESNTWIYLVELDASEGDLMFGKSRTLLMLEGDLFG
ncbi:MAG: hypothetical protein HC772_09830 [Leptolyngbyaceae cyanobacterium CRU_2_3]|nr:hypothetical protein [Leptolyngbyaceae cyanobacterium CRU_2_3]